MVNNPNEVPICRPKRSNYGVRRLSRESGPPIAPVQTKQLPCPRLPTVRDEKLITAASAPWHARHSHYLTGLEKRTWSTRPSRPDEASVVRMGSRSPTRLALAPCCWVTDTDLIPAADTALAAASKASLSVGTSCPAVKTIKSMKKDIPSSEGNPGKGCSQGCLEEVCFELESP